MGSVDRKRQDLSQSDEGDVLSESSMEVEEHQEDDMTEGDSGMEAESHEHPSAEGEERDKGEQSSEKEIEAVLAFFDPSEKDAPFVHELLLQQFKDIKDLNVGELTDTIIRQTSVGTVVRCEESVDDEFVLGVMTVLSFDLYKDVQCLDQMKQFVLDNCPDAQQRRLFAEAMEASGVGLVVNERLLNVPPSVGPPLNQALFEEMGWAQEDEPDQKRRDAFKMDRYVMLTCVYEDPSAEPSTKHTSKKSKIDGPMGYIYVKPEDEFYHKFSSQWFTFPLASQMDRQDDLRPLRLVLLVSHDSALQARMALDAVVGNAARPSS